MQNSYQFTRFEPSVSSTRRHARSDFCAFPPQQTFSTHMLCIPLPAYAAGDERSTALPSRGVNNSLAKSPPRDFDRPTGENSVHKEPASWRSGGSALVFRAAQCAQETFNALRAPVAHQELLGPLLGKTFQCMHT